MREAFNPDELTVRISELLVATADASDAAIDQSVPEVLQLLRHKMKMDVVFVSEFVGGERVFRFVDRATGAPALSAGDSGPVEESFCQYVVDGRLPEMVADVAALPASVSVPASPIRVGAYLSTPIRLLNGGTYGTLCCFSGAANDQLQKRDLENLRMCAQLVARRIEAASQSGEPPRWTVGPAEPRRG